MDHYEIVAAFYDDKYTEGQELATRSAEETEQKLKMAMEIGIAAYLALGRTADDYKAEYNKWTSGYVLWYDIDMGPDVSLSRSIYLWLTSGKDIGRY